MSPEQARGEGTGRTNGFVFLRSGAIRDGHGHGLPFTGNSSAVIFEAILNKNPPPPRQRSRTAREIVEIVDKALEKDRDMRYQSAAEMRADLKRLKRQTASQPSIAVPKSWS